jgi:uncharacterized membrane protein YcgQ (UPF0703/DUF1980 family)
MKDRSNHSLFIVGQTLLIHPTQIASNNQNRRSSLYQRKHPRVAETNADTDTLGNQVVKAKTWITLAAMKTGNKRSLMIRLQFVQRKSAKRFNAMVVGNRRIRKATEVDKVKAICKLSTVQYVRQMSQHPLCLPVVSTRFLRRPIRS